jgi:hypothetical protein
MDFQVKQDINGFVTPHCSVPHKKGTEMVTVKLDFIVTIFSGEGGEVEFSSLVFCMQHASPRVMAVMRGVSPGTRIRRIRG